MYGYEILKALTLGAKIAIFTDIANASGFGATKVYVTVDPDSINLDMFYPSVKYQDPTNTLLFKTATKSLDEMKELSDRLEREQNENSVV